MKMKNEDYEGILTNRRQLGPFPTSKERGKKKKEGLCARLNAPFG